MSGSFGRNVSPGNFCSVVLLRCKQSRESGFLGTGQDHRAVQTGAGMTQAGLPTPVILPRSSGLRHASSSLDVLCMPEAGIGCSCG